MLTNCFTPENLLPPDVGFSLFGTAHVAALVFLGTISVLLVMGTRRLEQREQLRLLRAMAVSMVVLELTKDFILAVIGAFDLGYLPLHLCSLAMFLCLHWAFRPSRDGTLVYCIALCGGLAALLFPDWTKFPLLHFQSVHSFVYHAMLVQFPLMAISAGMLRPRLRSIWKPMLFLVLAAIPVWLFNRLLGTNYLFLRRPVPGTPLEWCGDLLGRWYLLGYGILAAGVLVTVLLPWAVLGRIRREDM